MVGGRIGMVAANDARPRRLLTTSFYLFVFYFWFRKECIHFAQFFGSRSVFFFQIGALTSFFLFGPSCDRDS